MDKLTTAIGAGRRFHYDVIDGSSVAVSNDRGPFNRAAPSRSRTIRYDSASNGHRQQAMPRSQSVGRIDCLSPPSPSPSNGVRLRSHEAPDVTSQDKAVDAQTADGGSRLRKRLDVIRSNLMSRVARKRSDVSRTKIERRQEPAPASRQPEASPLRNSESALESVVLQVLFFQLKLLPFELFQCNFNCQLQIFQLQLSRTRFAGSKLFHSCFETVLKHFCFSLISFCRQLIVRQLLDDVKNVATFRFVLNPGVVVAVVADHDCVRPSSDSAADTAETSHGRRRSADRCGKGFAAPKRIGSVADQRGNAHLKIWRRHPATTVELRWCREK